MSQWAIRGCPFRIMRERISLKQLDELLEAVREDDGEAIKVTSKPKAPETVDGVIRELVHLLRKQIAERAYQLVLATMINPVAEAVVEREWKRYNALVRPQNLSDALKSVPSVQLSYFEERSVPRSSVAKFEDESDAEEGDDLVEDDSPKEKSATRRGDLEESESDIDDADLDRMLESVVKKREDADLEYTPHRKVARKDRKRKPRAAKTEEEFIKGVEERKRKRLEKEKEESELQLLAPEFSDFEDDSDLGDEIEQDRHPVNPSGCARTEPYRKRDISEKIRLDPDQLLRGSTYLLDETSTKARARTDRTESRKIRRGIEALTLETRDLVTFNQLKSRRKKTRFGRSKIHGYGLYALEDIEAHEFVIEYIGEIVRFIIADQREIQYTRQGMGDSYLFRLDWVNVVDATRKGAVARFVNHSCQPNLVAKNIVVEGQTKIVFYSKEAIRKGEELTYDYKFESEEEKIPCLCGAPQCRGYLN